MTTFWDFIGAIVISLGGVAAIVVLVIKFCGEIFAKHLSAQYELKLNKELEKHIASLDKKNYISKARFDKEFSIHQDISEKVLDTVTNVVMLFDALDKVPIHADDEREKVYFSKYKDVEQAYNLASKTMNANAPFITKELYELYMELKIKCKIQAENCLKLIDLVPLNTMLKNSMQNEYVECSNRNNEISETTKNLISKVREYLVSLEVYEK